MKKHLFIFLIFMFTITFMILNADEPKKTCADYNDSNCSPLNEYSCLSSMCYYIGQMNENCKRCPPETAP